MSIAPARSLLKLVATVDSWFVVINFVCLLAQAFDALDAWVSASREWTVGGRTKRLMMHSVHGCSRPAAVLCAWMMAKGAGKVTLADALCAIQDSCGQANARPNFGFVVQLLEYGALHPPMYGNCLRLLCLVRDPVLLPLLTEF